MKHTLNISICPKYNSIIIMFLFDNQKNKLFKIKITVEN